MAVDKDYLLNRCVPFGFPYKYKELNVYPIQVKDYYYWEKNLDILLIEKNYIGDLDIIQMSYLKFLIGLGLSDESVIKKLIKILRLVLRLKDDEYTIELILEGNLQIVLQPKKSELPIYTISEEEFEDIKTIICYQNIYKYDDKYVDPDIKKAVDDYLNLKTKDAPKLTLERKIYGLAVGCNMRLEDIAELPIRAFGQLFDLMVEEKDYHTLKGAELQGTSFKNPIEHWIYKEEKDRYDEGFMDLDEYKKQIR